MPEFKKKKKPSASASAVSPPAQSPAPGEVGIMVARHGIHLAVFLIKSHFGDLVSRVCECLLNRGTLSLQELFRSIELDPADNGRNSLLVKNCLLVLIQHNCVQALSVPKFGGDGGVIKPQTKYIALLDNILHRLRFAKFLAIVRNDLGRMSA